MMVERLPECNASLTVSTPCMTASWRSRPCGPRPPPGAPSPSVSEQVAEAQRVRHLQERRGVVRVGRPRCVSASAVAVASPTRGFPPRTLAPGRDVFGWLVALRFVREGPRGQQVGESQLVGKVQQRHLVPEMGPHSASIPTPYGVGIGPETASDLRLRQPRLLLELLQPLREVGRHDVDYSAVVNSLSRHCPVLPQDGNPRQDRVRAPALPQSAHPGALVEAATLLAQRAVADSPSPSMCAGFFRCPLPARTDAGRCQLVGQHPAVARADGSLAFAVLDTCYGAAGVSMWNQRERSLTPCSLMALIR